MPDAFTAHETHETKNCNLSLSLSLPWDSISNNSCAAHVCTRFYPSFLCVLYLYHITWSTWRCAQFVQCVCVCVQHIGKYLYVLCSEEHIDCHKWALCNMIILSTHTPITLHVIEPDTLSTDCAFGSHLAGSWGKWVSFRNLNLSPLTHAHTHQIFGRRTKQQFIVVL